MIRVDIETIIMASGPVPSLIVLRERAAGAGSGAPQRSLSIQTGSFEAAAISRGIDHGQGLSAHHTMTCSSTRSPSLVSKSSASR